MNKSKQELIETKLIKMLDDIENSANHSDIVHKNKIDKINKKIEENIKTRHHTKDVLNSINAIRNKTSKYNQNNKGIKLK